MSIWILSIFSISAAYLSFSMSSLISISCVFIPAVGSDTMDPHTMITDALSNEPLCFDYMGHDGDYIQLVEDSENGKY